MLGLSVVSSQDRRLYNAFLPNSEHNNLKRENIFISDNTDVYACPSRVLIPVA